MAKLNQIIAVANGKKSQVEKALTEVYHKVQKPELFSGISRAYTPIDDDGETLPKEEKFPQYTAKEAIASAKGVISELFDIVATQDSANTQARANVESAGRVVLQNVPVTTLLFLEKQLVDIQTFVSKLPVLDPAERWTFNKQVDYYETNGSQSNRNLKRFRNHVKAEATEKHPAQVDVYTEDVKVGVWNTVKFSGCLEAKEKNDMLVRVRNLSEGVKRAREEANCMEVTEVKYADNVLKYIFGE
jgi:hypothetical protein